MIWAATLALMLDRRFLQAAAWLVAPAVLSCFGLIHAFRITNQGVESVIGFLAAPEFAASYLAGAAFLVAFHSMLRVPEPLWKAKRFFEVKPLILIVWLGGLDSNQDSQLQRLMYYRLYDLPVVTK